MQIKSSDPSYKFVKSARNQHLTEEEHQNLFSILPDRSNSFATTICKVFESTSGVWKLVDTGVLCFIVSHEQKSFFLNLYNMDELKLKWSLEMYCRFHKKSPRIKI